MALGQSNLLQALGWAVFNSLWQMAILWVAYQLITAVFRINKPSQKGFLAAFLLFAGFAWFSLTLVVAFASKTNPGGSYGDLISIEGNVAMSRWLHAMLPVASILYLLLLILPILNFIRNYRYVQVIRRYGLTRASVEWRMFAQKISAQMGIRKRVYVWMSDLVKSPVTIGYLKPIILLPVAALSQLSTQQTEAVLLHELSHIKRYDYFINLVTKLIQTVLYFNPFVKAFSKIIETEREKSCDETVIQFQYEPHSYASALVALEKASYIAKPTLAMGAADGKGSEFRQRIEWILGVNKKPVFSFHKLAGLLAGFLCFIALNALLIVSPPVSKALAKDSFVFLASPFEYFADSEDQATNNSGLAAENLNHNLSNNDFPVVEDQDLDVNSKVDEDVSTEDFDVETYNESINTNNDAGAPFTFVENLKNIVPHLTDEEEKQVQQAMVESRKVMQEVQWQEVEKNIADALTRLEKDKVKEEYTKALSKIDWKMIENQLRLSYDRINWTKINIDLDNALAAIKLDSIQQVFTIAFDQVSQLQKELVKSNQPGIPDTDVTVKSLEQKKKEIQVAIDKIRITKPKKVTHL
jgi:bla regulator protein blaR1